MIYSTRSVVESVIMHEPYHASSAVNHVIHDGACTLAVVL